MESSEKNQLYDRQIYVLGHEAMKKMASSNILLLGLSGLGVEMAKNLILTGIQSITLVDNEPTSFLDLSTNFYLNESDIGNSRAKCCFKKLAELNDYVKVQVYEGQISDEFLKEFKVVVMADQPLDLQLRVNNLCHSSNIAFISAETHGVFCSLFCDFGVNFEVIDTNGEPPSSSIISGITQESPGIVTVPDDHRIPFEDGDEVIFSEIKGMVELNDGKPRKIKLLGPYAFSIEDDTTKYSPYKSGGYATQVKSSKFLDFLSLEKSLQDPEFVLSDFAKMDRPLQLHLAFEALHQFFKTHARFPFPYNEEDANKVLEIFKVIHSQAKNKIESIDEKVENLVKLVSHQAQGKLAPIVAFIGGVASQEVLKACSGKFFPTKQWLYFDAVEVLPKFESSVPKSEYQTMNCRYDGQIISLGKTLQEKITQLTYFLVGSGAIGCEVLKIWAMMGLGSGDHGMIHVTDMDIIERSNLSRQFLFRSKDVEKLKSTTAAEAIKQMNPSIHIQSYSLRVGSETENIFNSKFYESLDGVCNALDNVEARLYMDSQCVFYKKPLLESGTLGTKGNTQVIVPFLTESYASSRDPPEKTIPMCTLHHFPNLIEHTIQWARDIFEGIFKNQMETVNSYLDNPSFKNSLEKQNSAVRLETLMTIKKNLISENPKNFEDCILWARLKFEEYFNNNIQQLLYNFPADLVTESGAPFWSGPKRAPIAIQFDATHPLHLDFILSTANLRAKNYNITQSRDMDFIRNALNKIKVPEFKPKKIKINIDEKKEENGQKKQEENQNEKSDSMETDEDELIEQISKEIPPSSHFQGFRLQPIEFEKDVDTNFHMDFITAASNLRASNYSIPLANKHKAKGIAGKIIPAMVTTTAVVSGLVCLELIKTIQKKTLEEYKNGFVNLALPFFGFSEPIKAPTNKIREGWVTSMWDRFDVQGELTLQQFINYFKEKYQLQISMISSGVSVIYSDFLAKDKKAERLPMKLSELIAQISKKPIPTNKRELIIEIVCSRVEDDEDVEVPSVRYLF